MTFTIRIKELASLVQEGYYDGYRGVGDEDVERRLDCLVGNNRLSALSYASGGLVGALRLSYCEAREAFEGGLETARLQDEERDNSEFIAFNDDCYSSYRSYKLCQLAFKVWPKD